MLIDHLYVQFIHHPLQVPSNPTIKPLSKARIHASHSVPSKILISCFSCFYTFLEKLDIISARPSPKWKLRSRKSLNDIKLHFHNHEKAFT